MPLSKIPAIGAAVLALFLTASAIAETAPAVVVDPAIAGMTNDQLVAARKAAMREDGGILRGATALTGDEAVAAATKLLQNFTNFPALFREGSLTADSHALPIIWEQWAEFEGIFKEAQLASSKALEAALAGDDLTYGDAIGAIGQVCGECHQTYRGH
jgi:cytochrome c556